MSATLYQLTSPPAGRILRALTLEQARLIQRNPHLNWNAPTLAEAAALTAPAPFIHIEELDVPPQPPIAKATAPLRTLQGGADTRDDRLARHEARWHALLPVFIATAILAGAFVAGLLLGRALAATTQGPPITHTIATTGHGG